MAKFCKGCGIPIYGKSRKWCPKCKREVHLEMMHNYYCKNTSRWQYGGRYYDQQNKDKIGTGSLGSHMLSDPKKEQDQILKELQNLNLRTRKENWRYKD